MNASMRLKRGTSALALAAAGIAAAAIPATLSVSPAEARASYWCERVKSGRVATITCGGNTPTKYYSAKALCRVWLWDTTYKSGPRVSVKSGNGSGVVCPKGYYVAKVDPYWS